MKAMNVAVVLAMGANAFAAALPEFTCNDKTRCTIEEGAGPNGETAYVVTGDPGNSKAGYLSWTARNVMYKPGTWYGAEFQVNRSADGSEVLFDSPFHRDLCSSYLRSGWYDYKMAFRTFAGTEPIPGPYAMQEWKSKGRTVFANPRLVELRMEWRRVGEFELGAGEVVFGNRYTFDSTTGGRTPLGYCQRPFIGATKGAKTGPKLDAMGTCEYDYRFTVGRRNWREATLTIAPTDIVGSVKIVDFSNDEGSNWVQVAAMTDARDHSFALPPELFPCRALRMRIRFTGADETSRAQIRQIGLEATFDGTPARIAGATKAIEVETGKVFYEDAHRDYRVAPFGARLPCSTDALGIWTASSGWKVMRDAALPAVKTEKIRFETAANEAEGKQLVCTPGEDLLDLRVSLKECDLPNAQIEILRELHHHVTLTTDARGTSGWWPDAFIPQTDEPVSAKKGDSVPFFIRLKPPKGAKKGVYKGKLEVSSVGLSGRKTVEVPFEVYVFGFTFPDRVTLEATFGLDMNTLYAYHKPKTDADKRTIERKYLRLLSDSHVSPHPISLAKPVLKWTDPKDPEKARLDIDWTAFDRDMSEYYDGYHFNNFRLRLEGIGYSDHDNFHEPKIAGVTRQDRTQYEKLMGLYLTAAQRHLEEKGWISGVWVQTFDEPTSQHYDYVRWQNSILEKYAPKFRRMLTPVAGPQLAITGINTWCPVPYHLHTADEKACRARGDTMWWYICCSPPGTFVGMHIDHPGVDMRTWLWQSWDENITGLLYWQTDWWTGKAGYRDPSHPQNPYLDPVGWLKRAKPFARSNIWGNGEGRYLYPPLACADARQTETILDGPNTCYRLELLREGIEDYEYFAILRKLDPANPLLKVPKSVTRALDDYSFDPEPMETHRLALAREIERRMTTSVLSR